MDDGGIEGTTRLLRRIPPQWRVPDGEGGLRPASGAFQDVRDETGTKALSVYIETVLRLSGLTPEDVIDGMPGYGLVAFTAERARELGLGVVTAPRDDQGPIGVAHAHVFGKKTGAIQGALARDCDRVIWP